MACYVYNESDPLAFSLQINIPCHKPLDNVKYKYIHVDIGVMHCDYMYIMPCTQDCCTNYTYNCDKMKQNEAIRPNVCMY